MSVNFVSVDIFIHIYSNARLTRWKHDVASGIRVIIKIIIHDVEIHQFVYSNIGVYDVVICLLMWIYFGCYRSPTVSVGHIHAIYRGWK